MSHTTTHDRRLALTWPRRIDPAWTVNETLRQYPVSGSVFNAFGVDVCCGGARPLADAARDADIDPAVLLHALEIAVCPCDGECADGAAGR